jgi:hypothetical protein
MAGINYLVNKINSYPISAHIKEKELQKIENIQKANIYHQIKISDLIQRLPQQQSYSEQHNTCNDSPKDGPLLHM